MTKGIIGKKLGMTQLFDEKGNMIPVTVIEAGPCVVSQKKTIETDGYNAVQVGFGDLKANKVKKPVGGHFAKCDAAPKKVIRELRLSGDGTLNPGDIIKADVFAEGERVDISGTSKGKGFQGTIKRYGFSKLKESHGTGPVHRHPGSIGACASPGRVMKGKKLPGHMGAERVTIQNLDIVKIDAENNIIAVKGAVPGPRGGIVVITDTVKKG